MDLQTKLANVNEDNVRLIASMHEGLLILSKKSVCPQVMFCNTPVKKIIDTFMMTNANATKGDSFEPT